ncbi:MAG: S-adenosyl-l-methionine hydroxide adenosyltransferase family protein, partial [Candidatus Bathyarchaeota archaeon]|nr:S-adenosyl-l-methionine hydroxide adenosyltransferase family protein [Candidatus Bathyarchaeota archaeon]
DFGLKDPYVSEMKAVILSICPEASIVDISHAIEKFDIRMGAFILASAAPYFPQGTIHVAVVDPGVGTKRRPLIVETKRGFYVGPDNGLLMLSAREEDIRHVYNISNPQYMLPQIARTFHGRDIFAPAAAHLAKGHPPSKFGTEILDYVLPKFAKPQLRKGRLLGEVLYIDGFGNIITNISVKDPERISASEDSLLHAKFKDEILDLRLCSAYGQVPAERALAIVGSSDFLEISTNQADASQVFGVKTGDSVEISLQNETTAARNAEAF